MQINIYISDLDGTLFPLSSELLDYWHDNGVNEKYKQMLLAIEPYKKTVDIIKNIDKTKSGYRALYFISGRDIELFNITTKSISQHLGLDYQRDYHLKLLGYVNRNKYVMNKKSAINRIITFHETIPVKKTYKIIEDDEEILKYYHDKYKNENNFEIIQVKDGDIYKL